MKSTPTAHALALMGKQTFLHGQLPEMVPWSNDELRKGADEGFFLALIPRRSIHSMVINPPRTVQVLFPRQYENLPVIRSPGSAEWLLARFSKAKQDPVLEARHLWFLCLELNSHSLLKPYHGAEIKTGTVLKEGGEPASVTFKLGHVCFHCRPLMHAPSLVGEARKVLQ